jgi:hypothetical protein
MYAMRASLDKLIKVVHTVCVGCGENGFSTQQNNPLDKVCGLVYSGYIRNE